MAWDLQAAAPAPSYADHGEIALPAEEGAENELLEPKMLAHDVDFSTPIAQHAIATTTEDRAAPETREGKSPTRLLGALVDEFAHAEADDAELECLAGAIYFESKGEPLAGQLAVAEVIINRSKSGRYPPSLCGVVKQRGQFSFVRGGRLPAIPKDSAHWRKAVAIAHIAVKDLADSPAQSALAFHATYVSPGWRMKRVATVGNHIFYR